MAKAKSTHKQVDKDSGLSKIRHSASHLMAYAIQELYPNTKFAIGPATSEGFYYDIELPKNKALNDTDLPKIEAKIQELLNQNLEFSSDKKTITSAIKWAKDNHQSYKTELLEDLKAKGEKEVSFYTIGDFTDLCKGPHIKNTKEIGAIKLMSVAGAYWRGDEKNKMLTRIYGVAFATKIELNEYLDRLEEAKKRDHRIIGEVMELFSFQEAGPGFPFWHPKGQFLRNKVMDYMRDILRDGDYQEINTPIILNEQLWRKSGHWDHYRNNMYFTKIDANEYAVRPMNCPGQILVFKNKLRSYKDLPMRLAEFGLVHRHELSGVLHGLFRVRAFTQDDAHVYCTMEQVKDEVKALIRMIQKVYKDFGFSKYHIELSTRPDDAIGSDAVWNKAEKIMKEIAKEEKLDITINEGDGAFYGPKFDFHIEDSIGRSWQLGTIQLDFSMPERLGATYIDKDGKKTTPVMLHRAVVGSLERFIGILIEHYAGAFPFWLAPIQAIVLPISDKQMTYAKRIVKELKEIGIRVEIDDRNESLGRKIRDAEMQKIPKLLIVGDKEVTANEVSVRDLVEGNLPSQKLTSLVTQLTKLNETK